MDVLSSLIFTTVRPVQNRWIYSFVIFFDTKERGKVKYVKSIGEIEDWNLRIVQVGYGRERQIPKEGVSRYT